MYGKSFESKFTGSLIGAGFAVFSVWDYATTMAKFGSVELNPTLLAFIFCGSAEAEGQVREAIEYLCRPDPKSRSKEEDGRRLMREGEYQFRVVNWEHYQKLKSEEGKKEYNRRKQAEYREKVKAEEEAGASKRPRRRRAAGDGISAAGKEREDRYVTETKNGAPDSVLDAIAAEKLPAPVPPPDAQ